MDQPAQIYEIVVYQVKEAAQAEQERAKLLAVLETLPGFVGWTRLTDVKIQNQFTDIVIWKTLADAEAAGKLFQTDARFSAFGASIVSIVSSGHFKAQP